MAGVFTVVGVFAAAFVFALIWFIRRHRRRQRRKEWFASLRQYPPSPFAQASPDSQMRSIHTTTETTHDPHMVNYDTFGYRPRSLLVSTAEESTGLGLTNAGNAQTGVLVPLRRPLSGEDPFRDPPHVPRNTPVSFSPNHDRLNESSGVSIAPSSPSIYPESLPPTVDTPSPVDPEPKTQAKYFSETLLRRSLSVTSHTDAPPRPPRSYLRESQKVNDVSPLTPPASVSSHGHSDLEPQFIFHPMRRNTLHVSFHVDLNSLDISKFPCSFFRLVGKKVTRDVRKTALISHLQHIYDKLMARMYLLKLAYTFKRKMDFRLLM